MVVKVVGRYIHDNGRRVYLNGFSIWRGNTFWDRRAPITLETMQQIKGWGFNTINMTFFWGADIEPNEDQIGVYNETRLQRMDEVIELAAEAGLYVTLSGRVSHGGQPGEYPSWQGWCRDYHFVDSRYADALAMRQRFYDMWAMMIERFDHHPNLIGYNWWFFPWHIHPWKYRVAEEVEVFYNVMVPSLISVTRDRTSKIIFFSAYKQGSHSGTGEGWRDIPASSEFDFITPIADNNVVYCHGFHRPVDVERVTQIEYDDEGNRIPWNRSIEFLEKMLQPGVNFSYEYGVPMMVVEFGLQAHKYPDVIETGDIAQDRLDCYDSKLTLMDASDYHWVYWTYNGPNSGALKDDMVTPFAVVSVLRAHILTPGPSLSVPIIGAFLGGGAGFVRGEIVTTVLGIAAGGITGLLVTGYGSPTPETTCVRCRGKFMFTTYREPVWCSHCGEEQIVERRG